MTTIASDGKTVAADGQETWGAEPVRMDREKVKLVDGFLYAFTGVGALFDPCIAWYAKGADPKEVPEAKGDNSTWGLSVFFPGRVEYFSSTCPYKAEYHYPFALGSGTDFAMGAMLAGCEPRRAVEIAAEKNIHTGGKITVVEIPRETAKIAEAAE